MTKILSRSFMLLIVFCTYACQNETNIQNKIEAVQANNEHSNTGHIDFLKSMAPIIAFHQNNLPKQQFKIQANTFQKLQSKGGVVLHINPDDLICTDRSALDKELIVEIIELTNQKELLKANAQTVSDGRLLESGGAYHISITSNNKQVQLKQGRTMTIDFPKIKDVAMELFYGERDSLSIVNWKPAGQSFIVRTEEKIKQEPIEIYETTEEMPLIEEVGVVLEDSLVKTKRIQSSQKITKQYNELQILNQNMYEQIRVNQLGWINVDRFINEPMSDLLFTINPNDSIDVAVVYLVYKSMNSLQTINYIAAFNPFQNKLKIALGKDIRLIVLTYKNNTYYAYESNFKTEATNTKEITFTPYTEEKVKALFNKQITK